MSFNSLLDKITDVCPGLFLSYTEHQGQLSVTVCSEQYLHFCKQCLTHDNLRFELLIDLCAIDYLTYKHCEDVSPGQRFCVALQFLSIEYQTRLQVKVFCKDNERPCLPSLVSIYPNADWFEREAFDLFGIIFDGHQDLRRILTDYGFVGHPFRKDFPISGYVELRYDEEQQRIIQEPVSIEERENVPRVLRESYYARSDSDDPQKAIK